MVGSDWMCSQHMRRRPKIWALRLKILSYSAASLCAFGTFCGIGALSLWRGAQEALLKFSLNYCTGHDCPKLGSSYNIMVVAIAFDLAAVLFFGLQPRIFGKSLCKKRDRKTPKKKNLADLYNSTSAQMEGEEFDEDGEYESDEEIDPEMAMRMAAVSETNVEIARCSGSRSHYSGSSIVTMRKCFAILPVDKILSDESSLCDKFFLMLIPFFRR